MSSIFQDYEKEFLAIIDNIKSKLKVLQSNDGGGESISDQIQDIDKLNNETGDLLKQMDLEVRSFDSGTRKIYTAKMMDHRDAYNKLISEYQRTKESKQRTKLIGQASQEQRQKMMNTNDKLADQSNMIYRAQMAVQEADETGQEIIHELGKNREVLDGIRAKADEFSGTIDTASVQLTSMQARANRQNTCVIA